MVSINENLLDQSKYYLKVPSESCAEDMKYIVVHNTGNSAPAENEVSYMINNDNSTSFNAAVDDVEIVIGIPLNRGAFAAGTRDFNAHGIHIEICYSTLGGEKFDKSEKNAAEYIAQLLKEREWDISHVKKHQDADGKYCPHRTLDLGWDRFINMVKSFMGNKPVPVPPPTQTRIDVIYQSNNGSRWLPTVKNLEDYAGNLGEPASGLYMSADGVDIYYRVEQLSDRRWLPEVKNLEDYAGNIGEPFDKLQVRVTGGRVAKYHVHNVGRATDDWCDWITCGAEYGDISDDNAYAGNEGVAIDAIQIEIL